MGNTALKRRVAPARRVKVLPVTKRHDGDGEESRNGPDGGFHVTIQTPVPTITDTLQYSGNHMRIFIYTHELSYEHVTIRIYYM